ncbi:MAG: MFS transporter [Candidatus Glassbacteria bacterium]|nr:MFS transporter [Candidatus Glassbacteria bacterium]
MKLRNRHRIYLSSFLMDCVYAFVIGAAAVYAVELGATPVQLGILGASGPACYTLTCLLGGMLSDRLSRKLLSQTSVLVAAASCLGLSRATELWHLYLFYGLFNGVQGFFWPPLQSLLADSSHRRSLTATLGNFCISWSSGFIIGHLVCGYLTVASAVLPFSWAALINLLILAVNSTLSESEGSIKSSSEDYLAHRGSQERVLWHRLLISGWVANFTLVFTLSAVKMLFPKFVLDNDQMGKAMLGLMLALLHGGQFLMFGLVKYWHTWQYKRLTYLAMQLIVLPGTLLLGLGASLFSFAAAMFLIGLCAGFTYTASIYYSTSRPPGTGTRTGVHEAFIGMGIMGGPLAGGFVAATWNLQSPYLMCALLLVVSVALQSAILYRRLPGGK